MLCASALVLSATRKQAVSVFIILPMSLMTDRFAKIDEIVDLLFHATVRLLTAMSSTTMLTATQGSEKFSFLTNFVFAVSVYSRPPAASSKLLSALGCAA